MRTAKEVFEGWTPAEELLWTRFAKAAQFTDDNYDAQETTDLANRIVGGELPFDLQAYNYGRTVVIFDLPGEQSVVKGLQLFMHAGLQPIPIFNTPTRGKGFEQRPVVQTEAISRYLHAGPNILRLKDNLSDLPSFLLDYNRTNSLKYDWNYYDNRYELNVNDLPSAEYLKQHGIAKILYVVEALPHEDISIILTMYQEAGIDVQVYSNKTFFKWQWSPTNNANAASQQQLVETPSGAAANPNGTEVKQDTTPPSQSALWGKYGKRISTVFIILACLSGLNFLFQWFGGEPVLWTVPSLQWSVYGLPIPEHIGDIGLIAFTAIYIILAFALRLKLKMTGVSNVDAPIFDKLVKFAAALFAFDVITMTVYVFMWDLENGFLDFMGTAGYGFFAFATAYTFFILVAYNFKAYMNAVNGKAPAGWYLANTQTKEQRFWDGEKWTEDMRFWGPSDNGSTYVNGTPYGWNTYRVGHRQPVHHYYSGGGYSGYGGSGFGGYSSHSGGFGG